MPRMYVLNSWVGCAEDSYSGEQIGNRNSKSVGVHMYRDGDTYKANLAAYADNAADNKKQPSAYDKIMQDERKYDELEELSLALDKQYLDMQIDDEQYHSAKSVIEEKMYKQWQKLAKAKNWKYNPVYDSIENPNQPTEIDRNNQLEKPIGFWQYVFDGLDDSNLFKQMYKLKGI